MPVRAVFFDLGDTLMFQAHAPDLDRLYAAIGKRCAPLLQAWNVPDQLDLVALLRELYPAIQAAQPDWRDRGLEVDAPFIARGAFSVHGIELLEEQAKAFWRATAVGLEPWACQLYPDTLDTLRRLRALGIPAALVSNTWSSADMLRRDLALAGITEELLPVIVTSADVTHPKPHEAIFQRALDALDVAPEHAVFVGDSLEADVRGAKPFGMTTVWKLNGRHEVAPAPEADHVIHDLGELFSLGLLPEEAGAPVRQESLMPHEDGNAGRY